jgi:hypothetical protein
MCTYLHMVLLSFDMSCVGGTCPLVNNIIRSGTGICISSIEHWFRSCSNFIRHFDGGGPGPTSGLPVP